MVRDPQYSTRPSSRDSTGMIYIACCNPIALAASVISADPANLPYSSAGVELPGFDVALRGLSMVCTDEQTLAVSTPLFDGLYEYLKRGLLLGREPA